jgi:hypothetical protein
MFIDFVSCLVNTRAYKALKSNVGIKERNMKSVVAFVALLAIAFFVIGSRNHEIYDLKERLSSETAYSSSLATSANVALKLVSVPVWFIVDRTHVSSLPDGKGEIVALCDGDQFRDELIRPREGFIRPELNRKVRFLPGVANRGTSWLIVGNLIVYDYVK